MRSPIAKAPRRGRGWTLVLGATALLAGSSGRAAAQSQVPPEKQAVILTRALAYDNNLHARAGDSVVIAVLYKAAGDEAADAAFAGFKALEGVKVQDLPIKVVKLAYSGKDALRSAITAGGIDVLYCCPSLESELTALREVSQQQHVMTFGAREDFVRSGLSIGVFSVDGKATIMVNLPASRSEGASLASELLRLANVLR